MALSPNFKNGWGGRCTIKHTIKNKMKSNAAKKKMMMLDWLTVLKK